jgi:hypothetical protein
MNVLGAKITGYLVDMKDYKENKITTNYGKNQSPIFL